MKKFYYIFIAALALSAVSCTDYVLDIDSRQLIEFNTGIECTKSELIENTLPNGADWGVFGYLYPNNISSGNGLDENAGSSTWETKHAQSTPHIFYNSKVTYNGVKNTCEYPEFWSQSNDDKYTFFAYYPFSASMPTGGPSVSFSSQSATDAPIATLTMPWTGNVSKADIQSKMVDFVVASAYDRTSNMGAVPLNFVHVLYAIDFGVNNYNPETSNGDSSNDITISSVILKVKNFAKNFSFPMDSKRYSSSDPTTSGTYTANFTIVDSEITVEPNTLTGMKLIPVDSEGDHDNTSYIMLIPQTITTNQMSVSVTYKKGNGSFTTEDIEINDLTFSASTKYTITLNFLGDNLAIKVQSQPGWDGWQQESDNNTTEFQ